jgi:dolichol-phosphate mannosyltransferase
MRVLVVLPTYNEAENIEDVLGQIKAALDDVAVLVVDDGSPDGTGALVEQMAAKEGGEGIELLRRPAKTGLGSAYRDGFAWGLDHGFDAIVEMDADLSHDPVALPALVAPIEHGFDLVVGSRYVPGGSIPNWSWHRRLLSRGGNVYAATLLGLPITDSTSGFRAYSAAILKAIDLSSVRSDGYGFQIEMVRQVLAHEGRMTEVPIRFVDRVKGRSKMSIHIVVEALGLVTLWGVARAWRGAMAHRGSARQAAQSVRV